MKITNVTNNVQLDFDNVIMERHADQLFAKYG